MSNRSLFVSSVLAATVTATAIATFAADGATAAKSGFKKLSLDDAGFETFRMFGSEAGAAKYIVRDDEKGKYVGLFKLSKPLPVNNEWDLTVNEYLTVLQGELKIEFLNTGETFTVGVGQQAFLPVGSRLHLTAVKLPYAESFVMTTPPKGE